MRKVHGESSRYPSHCRSSRFLFGSCGRLSWLSINSKRTLNMPYRSVLSIRCKTAKIIFAFFPVLHWAMDVIYDFYCIHGPMEDYKKPNDFWCFLTMGLNSEWFVHDHGALKFTYLLTYLKLRFFVLIVIKLSAEREWLKDHAYWFMYKLVQKLHRGARLAVRRTICLLTVRFVNM